MKSSRKFFIVTSAVLLVILAACSNGSHAKSNSQPSNHQPTKHDDGDLAKATSKTKTSENTAEPKDSQKDPAKTSDENKGNQKDKFLKKLNIMEEADRNAEAKTTMKEMEEQESERYKKWDKELNQIYGVLNGQLDSKQMDKLREEERNWIKERDIAAKQSSLKYKGGSTESLEFVATQASITKNRCYELVARYMK